MRKPNIDLLPGNAALLVILAYIPLYGLTQLNGFVVSFDLTYFAIILPILLIDGIKSSFETFLPRSYKTGHEDLSKVTVLVPCKDGELVITKTVKDLLRRFPRKSIIVISNGSTDNTAATVRKLGVTCVEIKEPIGKVRAINAVVHQIKTPYALLIDDDTLIGDALIPTSLLDDGYEAVAFRVLVKKANWITRFQMYEYRKSCDFGKRYHNKRASVQNISGAVGLFRCSELIRQIEHHTGEFSGEDLQRTLLVHLASHTKGVVLSDATVLTEAPNTLRTLFRQRVLGWFPGLYANFGNYIKIIISKKSPHELRADAFYNCFLVMLLDVVRILTLPFLLFYPGYFLLMYATYVLLETIPFFKCRPRGPLWVLFLYPIYGLFGTMTRAVAFVVFVYRRLVVTLGRHDHLDDYRRASTPIKIAGASLALLVPVVTLGLNLAFNYSTVFTDVNLFNLF